MSRKVINFITKVRENLKMQLAGGQTLAEVKILRGMLQGYSLSPLLYVIEVMQHNNILRKWTGDWKFTKSQEKINLSMCMSDIKIFAKTEKEMESLIQTIRIYNQDIWIKLGIEKYAMLIMKNGKRETTKGIEEPNQGCIRTLGEKENYMYLEILKVDTIEQTEMK